ncbi:DUF438 domain-containing protein [Ancylomarina euxinus]|uniref:DUF438 domain-containing protein n=1 Tax=Ancylomarina euxinus TaxID=2283627 RepID=A0A425XYA0_9BACT|nr:PAS domain-containing protein [Ancylomarina euxinus]MCZ4695990.1 PAS domain-containing protein [Ancylomarina euxinus]MUP16362.1 DUF438 domain-containing protein [Ancylomarina euxinus]RRG19754.1 DUF438 domain-containing protein [Ancylomarina euxinus]
MSEFINNNQARIDSLYDFCYRLAIGEKGSLLIKKHQAAIDDLTANDIILVVHRLVESDLPMGDLKIGINKALNVFHKQILSQKPIALPEDHFLTYLKKENRELERRLQNLKSWVKDFNNENLDTVKVAEHIRVGIEDLMQMEKHYVRKENILFPYFEKEYPQYKCLGVMWSIHDDIRTRQKALLMALLEVNLDKKHINKLLGDLFFDMYTIIFREENLLFPVALNAVNQDAWEDMLQQSDELGYAYIQAPKVETERPLKADQSFESDFLSENKLENTLLNFDTGLMTLKQAILLLNNLPVDITMIDENDKVCFFSNPKERFFPRSKAIIGRTVQNCHPPESVHIVNELVEAFRDGSKDSEPFWIEMKGRFILIQYFALRDEKGVYKGCIEVSQDLTDIRKLTGEKRLM